MKRAALLAALLAGCASAPPAEQRVSIRVDGMVKTQGLT